MLTTVAVDRRLLPVGMARNAASRLGLPWAQAPAQAPHRPAPVAAVLRRSIHAPEQPCHQARGPALANPSNVFNNAASTSSAGRWLPPHVCVGHPERGGDLLRAHPLPAQWGGAREGQPAGQDGQSAGRVCGRWAVAGGGDAHATAPSGPWSEK